MVHLGSVQLVNSNGMRKFIILILLSFQVASCQNRTIKITPNEFLSKVKVVHGRRVFCKTSDEKTKITFQDLEKGFELYLKNDEVKKRKDDAGIKFALSSMYL